MLKEKIHMMKGILYFIIISIAFIIFAVSSTAESIELRTTPGNLYMSRIAVFSDINISMIKMMDDTSVAAVGKRSDGSNVVRIITFSQNRETYRYHDYTLNGAPTAIDAGGGWAVVGTDTGEILIIGRDMKTTYFAARGSVKNIYISGGKIVAFDGSYIYIYSYGAQGWSEIGFFRSTAIASGIFNLSVKHISPMTTQNYRDTRVLAVSAEPSKAAVFFSVSDGSKPVRGALVKMIYAKNPSIVISSYTREDGSTIIFAPIFENPTQYVIRITHPSYQTYSSIANISGDMRIDVILQPGVGSIETPENTAISYVLIVNASEAPQRVSTIAPTSIPDYVIDSHLVSLGNGFMLVSHGRLGVYFILYDQGFRVVDTYNYYYQYSGRIYVFPDGTNVAVVIDNKIYLYRLSDGKLVAISSYALDSSVASASAGYGVIAVVTSSGSLHMLRTSDLYPVLRGSGYASYAAGFVDADAGRISYASSPSHIMSIDTAAIASRNVEMSRIRITSDWGVLINGTIDIVDNGFVIASARIVNSETVVFIPYGSYRANIYSDQLGSYSVEINAASLTTIGIPSVRIRIDLFDNISTKPVADMYITITAWNKTIRYRYYEGFEISNAIIGIYNITVEPSNQAIYEPVSVTADIRGDTSISITVPRRIYPVMFQVYDQHGYQVPLFRLVIISAENESISYEISSDTAKLPYGRYYAVVKHRYIEENRVFFTVSGEPVVRIQAVNKQAAVSIYAQDSITGSWIRVFSAVIRYAGISIPLNTTNGSIATYIPAGYSFNVTVSIPGSKIYQQITRSFTAYNETNIFIVHVPRAKYTLSVKLFDDVGKPLSGSITISGDAESYVDVIDNGVLTTSIYAGRYAIEINSFGFETHRSEVEIDRDTDLAIYMKPTPLTFFQRYNFAFIIILVAISLLSIARYIERKVSERIEKEEKLF